MRNNYDDDVDDADDDEDDDQVWKSEASCERLQ